MRPATLRQLRRYRPLLSAIAAIGLLAVAAPLLTLSRPLPPERRAATRITVVSSEDAGAGSLREAIFRANQADAGVQIDCRAPNIRLESSLPPLIARRGTALTAEPGGCVIEASAVESGPVLDLRTADLRVSGLEIRQGGGAALLVRAERVAISDVVLIGNDVGVSVAEGANAVIVRGARIEENRIGVELHQQEGELVVADSDLRGHETADVWAVRAEPASGLRSRLVIENNRFHGGEIGALVLNVPARITDNDFRGYGFSALYIGGPRIEVSGNRLRRGPRYGIFGDGLAGGLIEGNEISGIGAVAVMLRYGRNSVVRANRLHHNAYGIAAILGDAVAPNQLVENLVLAQDHDGLFVLAESPMVSGNIVKGSGQAALRIVDLLTRGDAVERANPLIRDNHFDDNGANAPVRERHEPLTGRAS